MKIYMKSAVTIGCLLIAGCKGPTVSNSDCLQPPRQPATEYIADSNLPDVLVNPQPVEQEQTEMSTSDPKPSPQEQKKDLRGIIDVQGVMLSAADYMLDFRYRVIDPERASDILSRKHKPYLVDQATGAKMVVPSPPKVGPLRQTTMKPQKDRTYYVMFANPGKFIKRDSKVDVVIGDFIVRDIVVK
jgi:hypothetical protein